MDVLHHNPLVYFQYWSKKQAKKKKKDLFDTCFLSKKTLIKFFYLFLEIENKVFLENIF